VWVREGVGVGVGVDVLGAGNGRRPALYHHHVLPFPRVVSQVWARAVAALGPFQLQAPGSTFHLPLLPSHWLTPSTGVDRDDGGTDACTCGARHAGRGLRPVQPATAQHRGPADQAGSGQRAGAGGF